MSSKSEVTFQQVKVGQYYKMEEARPRVGPCFIYVKEIRTNTEVYYETTNIPRLVVEFCKIQESGEHLWGKEGTIMDSPGRTFHPITKDQFEVMWQLAQAGQEQL